MTKLDELLQEGPATELMRDKEALKNLTGSPEAKALINLLQKNSGDSLQQAAKRAMQGDTSDLFSIMERVMSTPEGAKAAKEIEKKISQ
ncbi:hypothetical protein SDC9_105305 [bioreactor metagenome]|uniref:Uncharacterized protein n=1 Tax=bioreactor metagenome TaxID=1076179 RepID=A0A645B9X7_9ZZZZ